jgi:hypothetical protein
MIGKIWIGGQVWHWVTAANVSSQRPIVPKKNYTIMAQAMFAAAFMLVVCGAAANWGSLLSASLDGGLEFIYPAYSSFACASAGWAPCWAAVLFAPFAPAINKRSARSSMLLVGSIASMAGMVVQSLYPRGLEFLLGGALLTGVPLALLHASLPNIIANYVSTEREGLALGGVLALEALAFAVPFLAGRWLLGTPVDLAVNLLYFLTGTLAIAVIGLGVSAVYASLEADDGDRPIVDADEEGEFFDEGEDAPARSYWALLLGYAVQWAIPAFFLNAVGPLMSDRSITISDLRTVLVACAAVACVMPPAMGLLSDLLWARPALTAVVIALQFLLQVALAYWTSGTAATATASVIFFALNGSLTTIAISSLVRLSRGRYTRATTGALTTVAPAAIVTLANLALLMNSDAAILDLAKSVAVWAGFPAVALAAFACLR